MRPHDLRRDRQAEARPASPHGALEGLEQARARPVGHARPGIADAQAVTLPCRSPFHPHAPDHRGSSLSVTASSAMRQGSSHAEKLLGVTVHFHVRTDAVFPMDALVRGKAEDVGNIVGKRESDKS
jgi:hypothetical protein